MKFGSRKTKSILIYLNKDYTNIELLYENLFCTNRPNKAKMIYRTPKSKKILDNFDKSVPNEEIPTSIPIDEEGWYLDIYCL